MRHSKKLRLVLCLGSLSGLVWAGTFATFTDSGTASSTFTAGTVDLLISNETDDAYAFTTLEMSNMKPGDVKYAPLTIKNNGTLGFTYSMATSATNADAKALRDQLQLEIRNMASAAACDSASLTFATDWTAATVVSAAGNLSAGAIASRSLAAGASEFPCFKVQLPSTAGDTYQGATTTATFTFSATQ